MSFTIKRLTRAEKTKEVFDRVRVISDNCFEGVERPPENILRQAFDSGNVWVAYSQFNVIVGFAIVTEKLAEPFLWSIAVLATWRDHGIGGIILDAINRHNDTAGRHYIDLTCKIGNANAQRQYLKAGYRIHSILKNWYGSEGDGLVMRRKK